MNCLRCGYCCIKLSVVIVDPKYVDDDLDFNDESMMKKLICKDSDRWCPYLEFNGKEYSCKIHDKEWYKLTPCYAHDQVEQTEGDCRIGKHILTDEIMKDHLKSLKGDYTCQDQKC